MNEWCVVCVTSVKKAVDLEAAQIQLALAADWRQFDLQLAVDRQNCA